MENVNSKILLKILDYAVTFHNLHAFIFTEDLKYFCQMTTKSDTTLPNVTGIESSPLRNTQAHSAFSKP